MTPLPVIIIGAGPSGLMAAEVLAKGGLKVLVVDQMPSLARKFLMAGRGGLNLTHSEEFEPFVAHYGAAKDVLLPALLAFGPQDLRDWADGLGAETFVGSSNRVFPKAMKASPLLRAWIGRLNDLGVDFQLSWRFLGFDDPHRLRFETPNGQQTIEAQTIIFASGGKSWPRLGSDGSVFDLLAPLNIPISPLRPANMGVISALNPEFHARFAGQTLKNIAVRFGKTQARGDMVITKDGFEGGPIYALSPLLREALDHGPSFFHLSLKPDQSDEWLNDRLNRPHAKQSLSTYLKKNLSLTLPEIWLWREDGAHLSLDGLRYVRIPLKATAGLKRAISSAGGIAWEALNQDYSAKHFPHMFFIGEMLDWEAPTGGYLLQACFSTAVFAAKALLDRKPSDLP